MDLIVSGLALSYQWWPSITHFEDSLAGKRKSSPAMVEHAGEVIYQAVQKARPVPGSKLTILFNPELVDLGHYLARLENVFSSVDQSRPSSTGLFSNIKQAADLIQSDQQRHVVICEISSSGSAAIILSPLDNIESTSVKIKFSDFPGLEPSTADYVVLTDPAASDNEKTGLSLQHLFQDRVGQYPVAIGCSPATSLSSELVALIQAILSIENRLIPASNTKIELKKLATSESPLYSIKDVRPWLSRGPDHTRSTLVVFPEKGAEDPAYIFLEEAGNSAKPSSIRIVPDSDPYLFPVSGKNKSELLQKLISLEKLLSSQISLKSISMNAYTKLYSKGDKLILSLLAGDREQLNKELVHARTGFSKALLSGDTWTSPNGSYFTAHPQGKSGVAFVYPGAFNSYPGMGKELFFSFPGLHDAAKIFVPNLRHSLAEKFLYIRSSQHGPLSDPDRIMSDFYQHPNQIIESGISLSVLHTLILDQLFDIRPDVALGYSLGETSMLWANRVWQDAKDRSKIWKRSSLFKDQLFGEMKVVRNYWGNQELKDDFWRSYILKVDRYQAETACDLEEMAFLSIINTPDEVVIVGEADACQRVIERLECRSLPMPFNAVIHNPSMNSTYPSFTELFNIPTIAREDIDFYSASEYQKLTLNQQLLAENMAKMTCNPVDFPRLVNQVYDDGARIFIEVGPQKTCTRWIEKILQGRPHTAIAINKRYQADLHGVLKVIAMLLSHHVDLDLSALFPAAEDAKANTNLLSPPSIDNDGIADHNIDPQTTIPVTDPMLKSFFEHMDQISAGLAESQKDYLKNQQTLTRNLARLMHIQASNSPDEAFLSEGGNALYTKQQITAFTMGDHRICFGNTFDGFENRRIPRLPNGDLQFIDRVIKIEGQHEQVAEGSSLVSEYDIPDLAWYKNGSMRFLPLVSIMELALQPCGFLSAYMGTIKGRENQDLYFRNLDGEGTLLSWPSSPTKTITNHVELISSSALEDVIIQKYSFSLSWSDQIFYEGTSSFGYFTLPMLENQSGLDTGKTSKTWRDENPSSGNWLNVQSPQINHGSRNEAGLPEIEKLWISPAGGQYSSGYIFLRMPLDKNAWFYQAHFYQDPVMPGSLGVETMAQALLKSASAFGLPEDLKWRIKTGGKINWKYRGQITPDIKEFEIELDIKNINQTKHKTEIIADGMLWKESKPIYKIENITLETY